MNELPKTKYDHWQAIIMEQRHSGQSIVTYCRERSIPVWQYYYWKKRLTDAEQSCPDQQFVALAFEQLQQTACGITVELPNSLRVALSHGFDSHELRRTLQTLLS